MLVVDFLLDEDAGKRSQGEEEEIYCSIWQHSGCLTYRISELDLRIAAFLVPGRHFVPIE